MTGHHWVRRVGFRVCRGRAARVIHLGGRSAASNVGLREYFSYASVVGLAQKNTDIFDRYAFLGLVSAELLRRATQWSAIARFRPSPDASARRDGLLGAVFALPTLLRRKHWTKVSANGLA